MDIVSNLEPDTHTNTHTHTHTYNGLNNYGNYGNYSNSNHLYNPMINRGFQNSNSGADDNADADAIYTLHNYLLALNLNTSNTTIHTPIHTDIHTSIHTPCGLSKKELEKNSTIIECHSSTDCPICLCNYPQNTYFYVMKCTHSFCIDCCETWFSKNALCPLCRKNYKL